MQNDPVRTDGRRNKYLVALPELMTKEREIEDATRGV